MTTSMKLTPMLQQYMEIKAQHEDTLLFYRMGDFYEMFFEDAEIASRILNITLTSRNNKSDAPKVPMCGVPYHAAQNYLAKLVKAGKRVAICEQVENPAEATGIVKREVIRVVSPGVVTEADLLDDKSNNYVCAITFEKQGKAELYGLSLLDATTGDFLVGEFAGDDGGEQLLDQLTRLTPSELLISDTMAKELGTLIDRASFLLSGLCITERPASLYHHQTMRDALLAHFQVTTLDGFGCRKFSAGITAAGILLDYISETQKAGLDHISRITPIDLDAILQIDDASRRNLELTQTIIGANREGSLIAVLDRTCTPMGARMLKQNLLFPLRDAERILRRLEAVNYLFSSSDSRKGFRELLDSVYDLERLTSRMILGSGNGRDMLAMKQSLAQLPTIHDLLRNCAETAKLAEIGSRFDTLADLHRLLDSAINPEAPITLRDGNLIREGYNAELDELIAIQRDGKQTILALEAKEREATGIAKPKVGFNKVFGYYFEIGRTHAEKIPEHYIRKQTLVNAERFITPELKEFEGKVLGAEERRLELEYELFIEVRNRLAAESGRLLQCGATLAVIDVLCSLAEVAQRYNYTLPEISEGSVISIKEGRHPVIERSLAAGQFVPNDVDLNQDDQQLLIITGPNMAGKSTVLRQTALIVLMAQMGSFVPAKTAKIGLVDKIFTRVGAMDDLRRGQSTFMVEMSETANILNNATSKSLVILDEIGRGTSTYDGLSIAWAVAEDLVDKDGRGVKTLFATHYHELTELAKNHERVKNYSIAVREWNDTIIFLHKLVEGGASRSYGIQVAGLAGVPEHVVRRAEEILRSIEQVDQERAGNQPGAHAPTARKKKRRSHPDQLSLFSPPADRLHDFLLQLDPDDLTPRRALEAIYEMRKLMKN